MYYDLYLGEKIGQLLSCYNIHCSSFIFAYIFLLFPLFLNTDLLNLLSATTESPQGLSDSDLTAVKVVKLLLPAVSVLSTRMVLKNSETQSAKIDKIYSAVRINRYAIDSQNQYSRRENFRISGIREEEGENLFDSLSKICTAMKVTVNASDIISIHRVGNKDGVSAKPRTVIVRSSRDFKSKIFANKKVLHSQQDFKNIYFNEDLTILRFKLLQFVKKLDSVKFVSTRDGKIHCQMKDNSKIVEENPDDLFKLGVESVNYKALGLTDLD